MKKLKKLLPWIAGIAVIVGLLWLSPEREMVVTESLGTEVSAHNIAAAVNQERIRNGLAPLESIPNLNRAASEKAAHMQEHGYFGHVSPDGITTAHFMKRHGFTGGQASMAIAQGEKETLVVINGWMSDERTRAIILHPGYTQMGTAAEGSMITVLFVGPRE